MQPQRTFKKKEPTNNSKAKAIVISTIVLLLLMGGAAWAWSRPSAEVVAFRELQEQIKTAPEEQRRELGQQMRRQFEEMSPADQAVVEREMPRREDRMNRRIAEYFKLSPAEQVVAMDKYIDEQIKREKERENRAQQRSGGQAGAGGGQPRGQQAGGGGGPRGRDRSDNARLQRQKSWLSKSSPEQRAQRAEFRRQEQERRQKRGLPPSGRPW